MHDIAGVPCRSLRAVERRCDPPVVVYAHGGGYVSGSSTTHRLFGSSLARALDATVVLVDYRLLPEHPISAPIDDLTAVVLELAAGDEARLGGLVVAGDSSGAALMVTVALALGAGGLSPVSAIVSLSGAFDATLSSPSVDAGLDPQLDRAVLEHWRSTIEAVADPHDPIVSPVFADMTGLPPALLLAGGDDVWRDDSVRLADAIVAAGGCVELEVVPDMWHCWPLWGSFPEAQAALTRCAAFVDRHCRTGHAASDGR